MRTCIFLVMVAGIGLLCSPAQAQLHYDAEDSSMIPEAPYAFASYLYDAEADVSAGGKITMHELRLYHLLPLIWDDPLVLNAAADLRWTRFNMKDVGLSDLNLYTIAGLLDVVYEGLYPLAFEGHLKAGLYSELQEIDGDDLRVRGGLRARYPLTPSLSVNAGFAYSEVFGDDEWHPVGGITWNPVPELEIRLQYPDSRVSFAPTHNLLAYIEAAPSGENWTTFYKSQEYGIRMESMRYGGGVEYAMGGDLWVRLFGGINTDRRFYMWKGSDVPLDSKLDDSLYVGLALILR